MAALEDVPSQAHDVAERATEDVLLDYGCFATLKKGLITLNSDYGLFHAAMKMTWNNAVDPNHSIDRIIKRTVLELPHEYTKRIEDEFAKTIKFARDAKHCLSKKTLRREPAELFPSLNCYLSAKNLQEIPTWCETRFRSLTEVIDTIFKAKDVLRELEMEENDPNQRFLASMPSFMFISPLQDMLQIGFKPIIQFADSQQFQQTGELIPMYESLLNWACIPADTNNFSIELKNCLVSAVMEQITGGDFVFNNQERHSLVKTRLLPNELVVIYGCPPRKSCKLEKIRFILKKGGYKKEAEMILRFVEEKQLKENAISQIKKFDTILNKDLDSNIPTESPSHSGTESSELSDEEVPQRSHSSLNRHPDASIENELKNYENESGQGSYENFKLFAKQRNWEFRKSAQGLILQNANLMAYWNSKKLVFPRLANIMLFVLRTPCSSSPLERAFSSITLHTSSHAVHRTTEYVEQLNQISPKTDSFFSVLNELYTKYK